MPSSIASSKAVFLEGPQFSVSDYLIGHIRQGFGRGRAKEAYEQIGGHTEAWKGGSTVVNEI